MSGGSVAAGVLMVLAGIWLILQTIAGDLAGRLIGLGGTSSSGSSSTAPANGGGLWSILGRGLGAAASVPYGL